ncbi:MAG: synthase -like, partial [Candidatus Saccharibacteria bacterium]|nr:synthase -like [Candidatus Saccharibacteria bacterium]
MAKERGAVAAKNHNDITSRPHRVAILDAGSQYGGLIDRNVREMGVRSELLPLDTPTDKLSGYDAIIISGGPKSVEDANAHMCDPKLLEIGKPIFGICYGMQLLAKLSGGKVGPSSLREDGPQETTFSHDSKLFSGIEGSQKVLMSHGDSVQVLPPAFTISGQGDSLISAIENPKLNLYGVQFHPEVFQTEHGSEIFHNFLFNIAGLTPDYTVEDQKAEAITYIQNTTGKRDVMVYVSGGVDSTVLAALVAEAIPSERIHAFHVDTGLMRANESKDVIAALEAAGVHVRLIDATETFAHATTTIDGVTTPALSEATDPQTKRKIIGDTFIKVRSQLLEEYELPEDTVLAQGTLRPDLIESGSLLASTKADTIKTHHNDTEKVRELRDKAMVVEPLRDLYKDQVRVLGRKLGLPDHMVDRHPFPGPGLGIRVLCTETSYREPNHDELQTQIDSFLEKSGYSEYRAHLLPVRTVGVQGDGRSYRYLAGIEGPSNWPELIAMARAIPNNNHAVNRVSYIFGDSVDREALGVTPTHL